ncbi:MAG: acyl-CoA synthetase [Betaproteobacteria bacterium]|nr:acyl-CoA synthetase [Betaproteobacteria bacterium]
MNPAERASGRAASPATGSDWTRRSERSSLWVLRVMVWISLHLGRPAGRLLLYPIAGYFLLFAPGARRASGDYLARVLGRPPRAGERFRHIFTFAATIHDRVYLLNERFDLFDLTVSGETRIAAALADGKGVFLIGAHLGSFEVMRSVGRRTGMDIAMVMFEENARKINATLAAINPAAHRDIIPLGRLESMLQVKTRLENGAAIGFLADRAPNTDTMTAIPFLGSPARFSDGPWRMAAMLRRPVFFMAGLYRGGNRYEIGFVPLADFSGLAADQVKGATRAAQARYVALLEEHCRKSPENWFNFFDFWRDGKGD